MRTKSNYILLLISSCLILTSSCQKWLEVQPDTQASRDELLTTETGFKDALTGAYLQMKKDDSYGNKLMFGVVEDLTSSWDAEVNSTAIKLNNFDYGDAMAQEAMGAIYKQQYVTIARINSILDRIDQYKSAFQTPGAYEIIKGECLALRAYCHLDLLRLFGPQPQTASSEPVIPYVTSLSKIPNVRIPLEQFREKLFEDLKNAEILQQDNDPLMKYSVEELSTTDAGDPNLWVGNAFFTYRQLRLNYYAVKALQARAHLWFGNSAEAYKAAQEVIEAKNKDGSTKFRLSESSDIVQGDLNLSSEHIFGLYDFQLAQKFKINFTEGKLKKGSSPAIVLNQLYENSGIDSREKLWEEITVPSNKSRAFIIKKYQAAANYDKVAPFQLPMLRLAEMYLIAIETASDVERIAYWRTFYKARALTDQTLPGSKEELRIKLLKEYRKEFFAEGQSFFVYKRLGADKNTFLWAPATSIIDYRIPIPKNESAQ